MEAKSIAKELKLDSKLEQFANKKSYVTLKDHKDNFLNSPKCRLINPAKSEIGIVSKHYLEKSNENIRKKSELQQWRNIGPFLVKDGRKQRKYYGAMFTCMSSRAVHIETTNSMSTGSFILALRRLIGRERISGLSALIMESILLEQTSN